jgi:hypothetical protein
MVVVFFLRVSPSFDHDADVKENVLENAGEAFSDVIVRSDTQSSSLLALQQKLYLESSQMVVRLLLLLPGSKTTRGFRDGSGRKRDGFRA